MTKRAHYPALFFTGLAMLSGVPTVSADVPQREGVAASVDTLRASAYPTLTRGQVVLINAQRLVVTQEPSPLASIDEAPPAPISVESESDRPEAPDKSSIWVAAHWVYGSGGFAWIAGRYIGARPGHVFVPPRWAVFEEQYLFFTGFFVPYNVYVRSHFNRYYYSGAPNRGHRAVHGPYWPIGAPTRTNSALTSAGASDPYWPIGARR